VLVSWSSTQNMFRGCKDLYCFLKRLSSDRRNAYDNTSAEYTNWLIDKAEDTYLGKPGMQETRECAAETRALTKFKTCARVAPLL